MIYNFTKSGCFNLEVKHDGDIFEAFGDTMADLEDLGNSMIDQLDRKFVKTAPRISRYFGLKSR